MKILLCSLAGLVAAIGVTTAAQSQAPSTVAVDTGELQGVPADGVLSFKGIPFAAPPVGELRWRPPQPAARWTGVRQAAEFGASCMQGRGFGPPAAQAPSEGCLYLHVWRPADPAARNLPVMVWFYGGGFVGGSSSSPNTSGGGFAKHGVILVSLNYRVGRFGFFAHPALSREHPEENKGAKTGDPNGAGLPPWPRHDAKKDVIFDFRPDGSAGAGPDARKARLDVTQKNTDAGKRSDF